MTDHRTEPQGRTEGPPSGGDDQGGPSALQQLPPAIPPVLYLPCRAQPGAGGAEVEMRQLEDGRIALLAYTALDRLASCQGPWQPWALFRTEDLENLDFSQPFDVIYLDQDLPEELRRPEPQNGEFA